MSSTTQAAAVALSLSGPALASAATYDIDSAHTSVTFSVRHMMVSNVRGEIQKVSGTIEYDERNPTKASVKVTIDPSSINTRDEKRDAHLRSKDFFDVESFPAWTFESTRAEVVSAGKLKLFGKLTMRGVTRDVILDVDGPSGELKDPWGNTKVGASASVTINRQEWGISWNAKLDKGGVVVGDEVKIVLDVEATKRPPAERSAKN